MKFSRLHIGTRGSQLAKWQALQVSNLLTAKDCNNDLIFIKSEGDINLTQPLYEMGVQGIFTKTLDAALLENRIDIAVHSYKDVPTKLAEGLQVAAVLKRANPFDVLVTKENWLISNNELYAGKTPGTTSPLTIATSSIRRKAQWLNRYPNTLIENIRGNVNTRLETLEKLNCQGALFAAAGLDRLNIHPRFLTELNWMLPAPAQGAVVIVCRQDDEEVKELCKQINDTETEVCTTIEKHFLKELKGGCSTPIGAYATIEHGRIHFKGNIVSEDGKQIATININEPVDNYKNIGLKAAVQILKNGGNKIIELLTNHTTNK